MILNIKNVKVLQGSLYQKNGEDGPLVCFDTLIEVIGADDYIWYHKHVFYGYKEDDEGMGYADKNALPAAQRLADKVLLAGKIDTKYWLKSIHVNDIEDPIDRLEREWSDNSDHFTD